MKNKLLAIILLVLLAAPVSSAAQKALSADQRKQYTEKMRIYHHQIITKELDLSRDQASRFFPIYDKMNDELQRIGFETRVLERKTLNNSNATALECENTARALFEQKKTESEIELRYFEQFKNVLTPRQLLKLKSAERSFRQEVIKYFNSSED